jgi:hypothetical protein
VTLGAHGHFAGRCLAPRTPTAGGDDPDDARQSPAGAAVRHRQAAERTLLTAIAAVTERAFADSGHSLDFINKAFE